MGLDWLHYFVVIVVDATDRLALAAVGQLGQDRPWSHPGVKPVAPEGR